MIVPIYISTSSVAKCQFLKILTVLLRGWWNFKSCSVPLFALSFCQWFFFPSAIIFLITKQESFLLSNQQQGLPCLFHPIYIWGGSHFGAQIAQAWELPGPSRLPPLSCTCLSPVHTAVALQRRIWGLPWWYSGWCLELPTPGPRFDPWSGN